MENFNYYKNNEFRNEKPIVSSKYKELEDYSTINNANELLSLGREFMTRGDKDGYIHALMCFDELINRDQNSFEAHIGEYKAWFWYCVSIFNDPFPILGNQLYANLCTSTPKKYLDEIREMYKNDKVLVANTLNNRGYYEQK